MNINDSAEIPAGINALPDPGAFAAPPGEIPAKRKRRKLDEPGSLTITSLMDVMTIILVFLIKSYATNPVQLKQAKNLKMPPSSSIEEPPVAAAILVTLTNVIVEDKVCATFEDGKPQDVDLSEAGMLIDKCMQIMLDEVEHQKKIIMRQKGSGGSVFDGTVVVMVDRHVPYELVSKVVYTAGRAEFSKFRFAVVKGQRS